MTCPSSEQGSGVHPRPESGSTDVHDGAAELTAKEHRRKIMSAMRDWELAEDDAQHLREILEHLRGEFSEGTIALSLSVSFHSATVSLPVEDILGLEWEARLERLIEKARANAAEARIEYASAVHALLPGSDQ